MTVRSDRDVGTKAGGVVSPTVMLVVHELSFPERSVAEYETIVVPRGYRPAAGSATVTGVHTSVADAASGVTKAEAFAVHSANTGGGQLILGGIVSTTVTLLWQELAFPERSLAEKASS